MKKGKGGRKIRRRKSQTDLFPRTLDIIRSEILLQWAICTGKAGETCEEFQDFGN